jgi:hypothetical protein
MKIRASQMSIEARQEGESAQDSSGKIMAPWTFSFKFPYGTQFTFGSLMFAAGENGNLELLAKGPAPKHLVPVYGQAPYLSASSSISCGVCSDLNPHARPYYRAAMPSQGFSIGRISPSPRLGQRAHHHHQEQFLIWTPLTIALRLGATTTGIPLSRVALLVWWPQLHLGTVLADTPPSEGQKRPMLRHLMME